MADSIRRMAESATNERMVLIKKRSMTMKKMDNMALA